MHLDVHNVNKGVHKIFEGIKLKAFKTTVNIWNSMSEVSFYAKYTVQLVIDESTYKNIYSKKKFLKRSSANSKCAHSLPIIGTA